MQRKVTHINNKGRTEGIKNFLFAISPHTPGRQDPRPYLHRRDHFLRKLNDVFNHVRHYKSPTLNGIVQLHNEPVPPRQVAEFRINYKQIMGNLVFNQRIYIF